MVKSDDNQLIVIFLKCRPNFVFDIILKSSHKNDLCYGSMKDSCENLN